MSKKIYVDAFFDQYEDFLQQMVTSFPEDSDWARYRTGIAVFRRANPMSIVKTTWDGIAPFEPVIRKRDDTFFLTRRDSDTSSTQDPIEYILAKLTTAWSDLSLHNRNIIWDYVTNIMTLAKLCVA